MNTNRTISTQPGRGRARQMMLAGVAALALGAVAPAIAHAQPAPVTGPSQGPGQMRPMQQMHRQNHGGGIQQRVDRVLQQVGASDDQKAKVHAIMDAAKTDIAPMRASMRDSRKQLRTLLSAPQLDTAAIETLRSQNSATMDKISRRISAAIIDAANVLTPDQRAKLATIGDFHGPNRVQ